MTLKEKLDYIVEALGEDVNPSDGDALATKLEKLVGLTGYAAELVAEAEETYRLATLDAYKSTMEENKPPSTIHSKVLDAMVSKELSTFTLADKVYASLRIAIDGLRTMISRLKTEQETAIR